MSEIEKQFFDTFGIESKYKFKGCENGITFYTYGCDIPSCKGCPKEIKEKVYPQITDRILLKLICYLSRYSLDLIPKYVCFKTIDQLKEHVLKCALKFKIANTIPMLYSQDLQALFKENN